MKGKQTKSIEFSHLEKAQIYLRFIDLQTRSKENEELQSEQRIKFFLTLVTTTVGLMAVIYREGLFNSHVSWFVPSALLILFAYGLLTLSRIIWRSRAIDHHDRSLVALHLSIEKLDPSMAETLRGGIRTYPKRSWLFEKLNGSLAQFTYVTEALLLWGIVFISTTNFAWPWYCIYGTSTLSSIVIVYILYRWSQAVRNPLKGS